MKTNILNLIKETEMRLFIAITSTMTTWFLATMITGYMSGQCGV